MNITFLYKVGDLKKYIQNIDDDIKLHSNDADCGGYDVCEREFINPVLHEGQYLSLGHQEFEVFKQDETLYYTHYTE